MDEKFAIRDGRDGKFLSTLAVGAESMLGMITPVTDNAQDTLVTDKANAERLRDKCNLSPLAKWETVEV